MSDYKVIKNKIDKKEGYSVQGEDGTIANGYVFDEKDKAEHYAELLKAFSLNRIMPHKKV